jgi:putative DNA primase/helicase
MRSYIDPGEAKRWFEEALRGQGPIKWTGAEGKCRCPFHEDAAPSFGVNADKGTWICYAGCGGGGIKELAKRMGIPSIFEERKRASTAVPARHEYDYFDAGGALRYQIVRLDTADGRKKVWQRRPDGRGGWINDLKGVKPLPYRLPELRAGIKNGKGGVIVAEGEKCVDALAGKGFVATTNHGGAGKWRDALNGYFDGCKFVVILPDNDRAGILHARKVAEALDAEGRTIRVADLGYPYVETHARDIYDWFAEGHTADELRALAGRAPLWREWAAGLTGGKDEPAIPPPEGKRVFTGDAGDYKVVGGYRMSDAGNALRLVSAYGKDIRYCHKWKKWLVWDGAKWDEDAQYLVTRFSLDATKAMYADADGIEDYAERKAFLDFAVSSENQRHISASIKIAADAPGIPADPSDLDADKYSLNCLNGTLDLRTGHLRPHDRRDMITKIAGAAWNENAKCPAWEKFMVEIMRGNEELVRYLQRALGYALTGSTGEQCFFVLYGVGNNGKSTLLNTIRAVMGGYARQASADTFMAKRNNTAGPGDDIAALREARFVPAIETEQNQSLAEAMIKQLTGGDIVSVRRLYENFFEFEPKFKIFLATNHKPNIRGSDNGIWRRIRLIPFEANIPDDKIDRDLPAKLRGEKEGILAWCVRGELDWQENGLEEPLEIRRATNEYRSDMDVIGSFLDERCDVGGELSVSNKELYQAFKRWQEDNGEREMSLNILSRRLADRGFRRTHISSRERGWLGFGLSGGYL